MLLWKCHFIVYEMKSASTGTYNESHVAKFIKFMEMMRMTETAEHYEQLVLEEDGLVAKIRLCEECQWMLLELLSRHGETGRDIGEEIVTTVHTIEQDLRTELLHLRLEKGIMSESMRKLDNPATLMPRCARTTVSLSDEVD